MRASNQPGDRTTDNVKTFSLAIITLQRGGVIIVIGELFATTF
jgi:hypothetical protein